MLEKERHVLIMEKIRGNGFVHVRDLMNELNTSRSSIMRDLCTLEEEGLLVREHGGATLPEIQERLVKKAEPAVSEKGAVHVREKTRIAHRAAREIRDGSRIFLDSGTTTAFLIDELAEREVMIVTPSVYLLKRFPKNAKCTLYLLGGQYDPKYDMNGGEYAAEMLEYYHFDAAFMSANGVDLETGEVMVADFALACQKKAAMKRSEICYLLIDGSKFDQKAACTYAGITDFKTVFTSKTGYRKLPKNIMIVEEK